MSPEIDVVLITPPRGHPLAAALRTVIERVARRPGVLLIEETLESLCRGRACSAQRQQAIRVVVGLEVSAEIEATLVLALDAIGAGAAAWIVPAEAFGVAIDGVERVQRLGSMLGAFLDLAASPDGRELMRTDAAFANGSVMRVLAGSAHLSKEALLEGQARALAARAAPMLVAALEEGRAWAIDEWALPGELEVDQVYAALEQGETSELLKQRALVAAEGLLREVKTAVDQALATHGLGALVPLQEAIGKFLIAGVGAGAVSVAPHTSGAGTPSDRVVREAEARLAALPRSQPGQSLLALGWAAPTGAIAGVALAPALDVSGPAGAAYALAAVAGTGLFLAGVGLAHVWSAIRSKQLAAARDRAASDLDEALAEAEHARRRSLSPEIVRGALTWLREALLDERRRLTAIEAHVRALGRSGELLQPDPTGHRDAREVDAAVDLTAARMLTDVVPERLVQRVRAELAGDWRTSLPTSSDVLRAARVAVAGLDRSAPWVARSDIAQALATPLANALATVDHALARIVPRGLPVRRLALMPRPFSASEARIACDQTLPSAGDAHLLVTWRSA